MKMSVWKIVGVVFLIAAVITILLTPSKKIRNTPDLIGSTEPTLEITTANVSYDEPYSGYLAQPKEPGKYPALVLIHEWWGLNDHIKDMAERFAAEGYIALAVDLYDGKVATDPDQARALSAEVRDDIDAAKNNLASAVNYLEALDNTAAARIGSVGWCFGGQWALEMAVNDLGVASTVMYYGQFDPEMDYQHMRSSILGHFGEDDRLIALDDVDQFKANLATTNGNHAVYIYPNAGHAFANDTNPDSYNPEAARLSWERTLAFLGDTLR